MPDPEVLFRFCQSLAALDAIVDMNCNCYLTFNDSWNVEGTEKYFSYSEWEGDGVNIIFSEDGILINGYTEQSALNGWKEVVVNPTAWPDWLSEKMGENIVKLDQYIAPGMFDGMPESLRRFTTKAPITVVGTTFCIWMDNADKKWQIGNVCVPADSYGDGSEAMLFFLDRNPATWLEWAVSTYDTKDHSTIPSLKFISHMFNYEPLTNDIIMEMNPSIEYLDEIVELVEKIGYPIV